MNVNGRYGYLKLKLFLLLTRNDISFNPPIFTLAKISKGSQRGQLTGRESFVDEVEIRLGKRIEMRGQGRPREAPK